MFAEITCAACAYFESVLAVTERRASTRLFCFAICTTASLLCFHAQGQGITFSVDYQGPAAGFVPGPITGALDGFGITRIDEGSILTTAIPGPLGPNPPLAGPLPFPGIMVGAVPGSPGSIPGGMGIMPGVLGGVELDALSYGHDFMHPVQTPMGFGNVPHFSVDEFAAGVPVLGPPEVASEGAFGFGEAAADVFAYMGPFFPMPPGPAFGNVDVIDGDGVFPFGGPGTGLLEPNIPTLGNFGNDDGDNLDAVDVDTGRFDVTPGAPIYFSLDSNFPDPLEVLPGFPPPPNTGTAVGNGASGADVLVTTPGALPFVFVPGTILGLDLLGFDTDDLDALAFFENGDGVATPTAPGLGGDEILFSVRRGSAVIGALDSAFGIPIEEGDILTVPTPGGAGTPSIFIPAELMGLATVRSGTAAFYPGFLNPAYDSEVWADDLDALDVIPESHGLALLCIILLTLASRRERD